jgi:integrase
MVPAAPLIEQASRSVPKLTKRFVEALEPATDGDVVAWDSELPGFGVRVWPSGKRTYILKYRTREGRQRKVTIGQHGLITAEQARVEALRQLSASKLGQDPALNRLEARKAPAMADLAERYIREHAAPKKRPGSAKGDETLLRLHILPRLGAMKVAAIGRQDISRLHHSMQERPGAANRTLALLSKMLNLAEKWGLRPDGSNPCRHVQRFRENKTERFLSHEELARLGEALSEAERAGTEMPSVVPAIRLLLLTGCRLSEVLTLRWTSVDFENQCIRLSESKTGAKTVYLSTPALDVLRAIPRQPENPFVIRGDHPGSHLVNLRKPWYRIRARAGLHDVRIHDLRHSFASVAATGGASLPMIGKLLGHSQPATTARYAHLAADPVRQMNEDVGQRIAGAMKGFRNSDR